MKRKYKNPLSGYFLLNFKYTSKTKNETIEAPYDSHNPEITIIINTFLNNLKYTKRRAKSKNSIKKDKVYFQPFHPS